MAAQRNQAARENLGRRGGMMGMLGGLALGGLLGAMFFGGAFEGINFMDILIFAGIAFLLYKLFASRTQSGMGRPATVGQQSYGQSSDAEFDQAYQRTAEPASASNRAGFNTDVLFNRGGSVKPASAQTLPADFDKASFLKGAKAAYVHLQAAWDKGDLAELRGLCTDRVFGELQDQIKQREGANHTELLEVDMELLEVADNGSEREATVLFDVLLRENPGLAPAPVKEVWHFIRSNTSQQPIWYLDGIQQLEE
jgi:predicted lipid-binding transport protein (Tim44 family)